MVNGEWSMKNIDHSQISFMKKADHTFSFDIFDSIKELNDEDALLLNEAKQATALAYAPYSRFRVSAVAKLVNGKTITGTNQENASFPIGICAERVLLSVASSLYPCVAIETIAITYFNETGKSDHPISPCGICRQSLHEYEQRLKHPIRLILSGSEGKIFIINKAGFLLPLAFTGEWMK
jgi:cytidine deaminase